MNSKLIVFLIFSLFCISNLIEAGGGSEERKSQRDTCGGFVRPEPSSSSEESGEGEEGSGGCSECEVEPVVTPCPECEAEHQNETSTWAYDVTTDENVDVTDESPPTTNKVRRRRCQFTRALYNMSLTLSYEYQILIQQWIYEIETTYLVDITLSEEDLVVLIGYKFKKFGEENPGCWDEIKFKKLGSWGYSMDFVYVAKLVQVEKTSIIIELDSDDNCDLFEALRNSTKGDAEAEKQCEELIIELLIILKKKKNGGWSEAQVLAACYSVIEYHMEVSVELKQKLKKCHIKGYGSFESFADVTLVYERTTTVSNVIGGSTSECVLLKELENAYMNVSVELSVRLQIKELTLKIQKHFESNKDINLRLKYVSEQCFAFFKLLGFNVKLVNSIKLGSWGTIYDLTFCSHVCTNYGCGDVNAGPGTDATTESPKQPGECGSRTSLVVIQSDNTTILTRTIESYFVKWNTTQKIGFQSYFNQIKIVCYNLTLTAEEKIEQCSTILYKYNANAPSKRFAVLSSIEFSEWGSTLASFVSCTKTITSTS